MKLQKCHGDTCARLIQKRMRDIMVAQNLTALRQAAYARCHYLGLGQYRDVWSVDVEHPYRLLFKPDHNPIPQREDGGHDTDKIDSVLILYIADTH